MSFAALFAALHLAVNPLLVALVAFAALAALGCAHFLANKRKEGIVKADHYFTVAQMAKEAGAEHFEAYFRALATGDIFEAARQRKALEKLSQNPQALQRKMDQAAEKWLEHEIQDPHARRRIVHDIHEIERRHHGDETSAIAAAVEKILKGVKETATVPDGAGGTTTVPVKTEIHHHHYGEKPADVPPAPPASPAAPAAAA